MPADRRALRNTLAAQRDAVAPRRLVGFDFDCTLTIRHFYKVFAWGYAQGSASVHSHCKAFFSWCEERNISAKAGEVDFNDPMGSAVDDFCRRGGEDAFKEVFREVFLGGNDRIALVATWLERMQHEGVEFAIVTAGTSSAVLRALSVVPEWQPFFPASHVWDTSQGRHTVRSIIDVKLLILRDICPTARRIVLIDDSLCKDRPSPWVLSAAAAEVNEGLPYEGTGVSDVVLKELEQQVLA